MADYRQIHTRIWKDEWFSELEPDARLLFIYLFSNERASVSGMYELPLKFIVFESGIAKERVLEIFKQLEDAGKVYYRDGVVWVVNLRKYNDSGSPKVYGRIVKDIEGIPDGEVKRIYCQHHQIPYQYPIDTPSKVSSEQEQEQEQEQGAEVDLFLGQEVALYREITGLVPDMGRMDEVKRNIQSVRTRLKYPPIAQLKEYLTEKYKFWCASKTPEGRSYNPTNPKWIEWAITDYTPTKHTPQPAFVPSETY